jgi:hypothetical protein
VRYFGLVFKRNHTKDGLCTNFFSPCGCLCMCIYIYRKRDLLNLMKHVVINRPFTVFTVQNNTALDSVTGINVNTLEKINK